MAWVIGRDQFKGTAKFNFAINRLISNPSLPIKDPSIETSITPPRGENPKSVPAIAVDS